MRKALLISTAIAFLVPLSQLKADEPLTAPKSPQSKTETRPPAKKGATDPWLILCMVRDLAEFDISSLNSETTGAWIVASILPHEQSGSLFAQGMYIKDGKAYDSGIRPREVIRIGGRWKLIEVLSGKAPPSEGRFQWQEPHQHYWNHWNFSLLDMSSVFTSRKNESTVICQYFENKTGAAQFASVTPFPDHWKPYVKPARDYYLAHADEFTGDNRDKLLELASGKNPFLSLQAVDHLLSNSSTDEQRDELVDLLLSFPKYRQAVLVVKLLNRNDEKLPVVISGATDRATNANELVGIALGVQTWALALKQPFVSPDHFQQLFGKARQKWKTFDPALPDDWLAGLNYMVLQPGNEQVKSTQAEDSGEESKDDAPQP